MAKDLITVDPDVMMGKPVVAGTRITVEHILEELGRGRTLEDLVEAHPHLTSDSVRAILAYMRPTSFAIPGSMSGLDLGC